MQRKQLGLEVTAFLHLDVEVFGEHLEALNVLHAIMNC